MRLIQAIAFTFSLRIFTYAEICSDRKMLFPKKLHLDSALLNHTISTLSVKKAADCRSSCFVNHDCVSYNIGETSESVDMVCQLNDADHFQYHQDLINVTGFSYHGTKSACYPGSCHKRAKCQHGFDSRNYRCICPLGMEGYECRQDINECDTNTHNCSKTAGHCRNTHGSFKCSCHNGYAGDGYNCTDIDECQYSSICNQENESCVNSPGTYFCFCNNGFQRNGSTCKDVDECASAASKCPTTAGEVHCKNFPGGFNCECNPGFTGSECSEKKRKVKANTNVVCVGARDDQYGSFTIPETGIIITFNLIHKYGGVSTHNHAVGSKYLGYWGPKNSIEQFHILVTDVNKTRIAPPEDYKEWGGGPSRTLYKIPNQYTNQTKLELPETSIPRNSIKAGTEFRIWFGEDLENAGDGDNTVAKTCMDVEVVYRDTRHVN